MPQRAKTCFVVSFVYSTPILRLQLQTRLAKHSQTPDARNGLAQDKEV